MTAVDELSLRLAERDYHEAQERTEELRLFRNELFRKAIADGWKQTAIAEATGLTRGRIGQLAQTPPRKPL